jgi:hypothetical protein
MTDLTKLTIAEASAYESALRTATSEEEEDAIIWRYVSLNNERPDPPHPLEEMWAKYVAESRARG